MSRTYVILALITKWVVIPVALLAIGFFFVGPKIGAKLDTPPQKTVTVSENTSDLPPTSPTTSADTTGDAGNTDDGTAPSSNSGQSDTPGAAPSGVAANGNPDITVTVRRGAEFTVHTSRDDRTRHHRKRKRRLATPASPSDNVGGQQGGDDAGGSGGGGGQGPG